MRRAFAAAYPAGSLEVGNLHFNLWQNRLFCDSLSAKTRDSGATFKIARCSIKGAHWARALLGKRRADEILANAHFEANGIALTFPDSEYALCCERLRASAPDSVLEFQAVELHPVDSDEQFFSASPFRRSRLQLVIPKCKVSDLAWPGLLQGKGCQARLVEIHDMLLDVLTNPDKPVNPHARGPFTPSEALLAVKRPLVVGNLNIRGGRLNLAQRRIVGADPGVLTFGRVQLFAEGISNQADRSATATIQAQGDLMDAATLKVTMEIPLTSPELSFHYSGSLGQMDLSKLNSFLEVAGHTRINSGKFREGTFLIDVRDGHANGQLRALYADLNITLLDKETGSEGGAVNQVKSFLADHLALHTSNNLRDSDSIKIGTINYTRGPQERFPHFLWFAVRDGIFDVLGLNEFTKRPK